MNKRVYYDPVKVGQRIKKLRTDMDMLQIDHERTDRTDGKDPGGISTDRFGGND